MKVIATIDTKFPQAVHVHCEDDDNIAVLKNISYQDFVELLTESRTSDCKVNRIGTLPVGFIDGGYETITSSYEAIIHLPAGTRPMRYFDEVYIVPFPDLVFYMKAQKGKITSSKVFALESGDTSEKAKLYRYPYGNVYDDGRICWGSNASTLPKIHCLKDFEKVVTLFFGAETNNDLYQSPKIEKDGVLVNMPQTELVKLLQGKENYPVEFLNPSRIGTMNNL